ncbi:hypothetical protein JL720_3169 [Aureococcus anophagefferens]|nr:hypothetical protein JL720_3169 [Aureococcus anophagefferens]
MDNMNMFNASAYGSADDAFRAAQEQFRGGNSVKPGGFRGDSNYARGGGGDFYGHGGGGGTQVPGFSDDAVAREATREANNNPIFKKERHPIDSHDSLYGVSDRSPLEADPRDYESDDEELPIIEEIDEYDAPTRGRGPPASDSTRSSTTSWWEAEELEPEYNAELEGFERYSDATGLYSGDKQEPRIPKHLELKLWDLAETEDQKKAGVGLFKACECDMDDFQDVYSAMVAPEQFDEEIKANPPIGSWHLYVSKYAFIDGMDEAEFRYDVIPGDGLSRAGTTSTFTRCSLEIRADLLEHRAGARSWTFCFKTHGDIVPVECKVKVYPKKKKIKVVVRKATRGYWDKPGRIYAPITKANYRDGLKLTDCNRTY